MRVTMAPQGKDSLTVILQDTSLDPARTRN